MRDTNENMIELLSVSKTDNTCSSVIRHKILDKELNLRFGSESIDYEHLKRILEFRPFENTGVAPYRYFFALSYSKDSENDSLANIAVRVEQLDRHKQYDFKISRKYIANLLWFETLTDTKQIEQM